MIRFRSLLNSLVALITAFVVLAIAPIQRAVAQETFITGEAGAAWLGLHVIGMSYGEPAITTRVGVGNAFDHFEVEFDVGAVTGLDTIFTDGVLVVPSMDMRYLFRQPDRSVRPYVGGGLDAVFVVSHGMAFGLPWAHLTLGVDTAVSEDASIYLEARTYALESQLSLGTKLTF